jgi:DNA (cytosine-5)-methyltransferase 1
VALHPAGTDCRGLSLCAGIGALDLGVHIADPAYRCVGYVERDAFAAATLVARMEDEALDRAPVWDDVATFDGRPWRGRVDIVLAGYPCQPFSSAGHRRGDRDPRHLWPQIRRIIAETGPRRVFLENVAGHVDRGFDLVFSELSGLGYRVEAGLFSAAEVGAPHWRTRLFVLADADRQQQRQRTGNEIRCARTDLPDPDRPGRVADRPEGSRTTMVDPATAAPVSRAEDGRYAGIPVFPPAPLQLAAWDEVLARSPELEPCLHGLADGLACRVERSVAAGNGVVALAAAYAYRTLSTALTGAVA